MRIVQDKEFLILGHSDGKITIYNILTTKMIRSIQVSAKKILSLLLNDSILNLIALDEKNESIFKQYDWKNSHFVESQQSNQSVCTSECDNTYNKIDEYLACRICNPAHKCATCDSSGCITCNPGQYLDNITLPSGQLQKVCVLFCPAQLFGLLSEKNQNPKCVEVCPLNVYNIEGRICSSSSQIQSSNEFKGLTANIKLSLDKNEEILTVFDRPIIFNNAHILQSQQAVKSMKNCIIINISKLKSSDFTFEVNLDPEQNTFLSIKIKLLQKIGVKDPKVTIKFEGQTCFKDANYIPLSSDLVLYGLNIALPWNIINYDESTIATSEAIGKGTQIVGDTVVVTTFPLYLTNIMYIFWILINVFQLVNFLLYLNVKYPINVINFFRAFKSFNFHFLHSFGIDFNSKTQEYSFLGYTIIDETPALPFQREGMTSSFYLNGLKFIQTFFILYIVLYVVRIIARIMKINCRVINEDSGIIHKVIGIAQQKIEYTTIITSHQSSLLQFSIAIFLQIIGFSTENIMNVIGFTLSCLGLIYLIAFLKKCYQKVNLHEMVVGTKISDKLQDQILKDKYEVYKMQYGVLYWNVNFIFYGRRNYHVYMMFKRVLISFTVVFMNQFTYICIFILIIAHSLNSVFLLLKRPFDKKLIGYLCAVNEICMTVILCLILYIHILNESYGDIILENEIDKLVNIGWIVITLLLILFLVNIVSGFALEWDSIKEAFNKIKQKIKELTSSEPIQQKDPEEILGFSSSKVVQFQLFNNDEKKINLFKDLLKNKSSQSSSDSDQDTPQQRAQISNETEQSLNLSKVNIKQSLINSNDTSPSPKKSKKQAIELSVQQTQSPNIFNKQQSDIKHIQNN